MTSACVLDPSRRPWFARVGPLVLLCFLLNGGGRAGPACAHVGAIDAVSLRSTDAGGSASFFVRTSGPEIRFRLRLTPPLRGKVDHFLFYLNGRFAARLDRTGAIDADREGQGIDLIDGTGWITWKEGVRTGLNRLTLVRRGRLSPGDHSPPGPGEWTGRVELLKAEPVDLGALLKGFSELAAWEASSYEVLEGLHERVVEGLRPADRATLRDQTRDILQSGRLLLGSPSSRPFLDLLEGDARRRSGRHAAIRTSLETRLRAFELIYGGWAGDGSWEGPEELSRPIRKAIDYLRDVALARANLASLHSAFMARLGGFEPGRFRWALALLRQSRHAGENLLEALPGLRRELEAAAEAASRDTVEWARLAPRAFGFLHTESPLAVAPHESAMDNHQAYHRWVQHFQRLEDYVRADLAWLRLEAAALRRLIGEIE